VIDLVAWAKEFLRLGNIVFTVAVLATGALLLFVRPRWGRRWIVAVALGYWLVSTPLGSSLLVRPIARGYHPLESAAEAGVIDAIVVLGGGIGEITAWPDALRYPSYATALRTLEAARVYRLLDRRPIVVASGGMPVRDQRMPEARVIADALIRLDIPADRVVLEDQSVNTHEQAIMVTRLLASRGIHRFVLITSPPHMARSAGVFRAQHADVVPSTAPLVSDNVSRLAFYVPNEPSFRVSDETTHEYGSLVYYWARGWFKPAAADAGR
jgi:uncharacterized SAM-binding protein YcdF (DUF218 family)